MGVSATNHECAHFLFFTYPATGFSYTDGCLDEYSNCANVMLVYMEYTGQENSSAVAGNQEGQLL